MSIRIQKSPLTDRIFAGRINKAGNAWLGEKKDVTGEACAAVALHAMAKGGTIVVTANGKPEWEVTVAPVLRAAPPASGEAGTVEQDAFEAWANREGYDMAQHPLHYLFLNERTYAARQGWKAGIRFAATPTQETEASEAVRKALEELEEARRFNQFPGTYGDCVQVDQRIGKAIAHIATLQPPQVDTTTKEGA
jgi:hypothetical protein